MKAAENGLAEAQYMMGLIYDYGECRISCDKAKAKKWYELSAEQGNQYAIERLNELS